MARHRQSNGGSQRCGWPSRVAWTYAAAIGAWFVLRSVAFDRLWWLALLNTDALVLFVPVLMLFPLALWWRRRGPWVALAVPTLAFGVVYGEVLLPPMPGPGPEPGTPAITAMTLNVLWSNEDYPRLIAAVRAADPDIVGLQELRAGHRQAIDVALAATYPFRAYHADDPSIGLLSRFPIDSVMAFPDPRLGRALLVRLSVGGRPLTAIVTHLTPTNMLDQGIGRLPTTVTERYGRRAGEVLALLAAVRTMGQAVIVLCDCNFTDTSEAYASLRTGMTDSFAAAGWGIRRTMVAGVVAFPAQRLDYVWHSAELLALDAWVGSDGGSDHLPAVARLAWR